MMCGDSPENEDCQWCEVCRVHKNGHCDGCQRRFDPGEASYKSASYHFHPAHICGISGSMGVNKLLCVDCYRKDYAMVSPRSHQPELPDRVAPEESEVKRLFRQVVKAVHPDLAKDAQDRERRNRWMAEANRANDSEDVQLLRFILRECEVPEVAYAPPSMEDFYEVPA